jgi:hypothetical protein
MGLVSPAFYHAGKGMRATGRGHDRWRTGEQPHFISYLFKSSGTGCQCIKLRLVKTKESGYQIDAWLVGTHARQLAATKTNAGSEIRDLAENSVMVHVSLPVRPYPKCTMNELKQRLSALGLSEEQVDGAIKTVAEFVKSKLPPEYQGAVDSLMAGETPDLSALGGGLLDKVKGMFS